MSAEPEGVKQEEKKIEHINVSVADATGGEISFKVKRTTPLYKLMDAYCAKTGQSKASTRFMYEGERINDGDTPEALDMEDGDKIQVFVNQVGGMRL